MNGLRIYIHTIVQVLPLKKMREACNLHHSYTSTMTDEIRKKNPENHIVGFLMNFFANHGVYIYVQLQASLTSDFNCTYEMGDAIFTNN
jgi:hypothetical protein